MKARAYKMGSSPFIKHSRASGWKPAKDTKYWMKSLDIQKTEEAIVSQADKILLEVCYQMERANQRGKWAESNNTMRGTQKEKSDCKGSWWIVNVIFHYWWPKIPTQYHHWPCSVPRSQRAMCTTQNCMGGNADGGSKEDNQRYCCPQGLLRCCLVQKRLWGLCGEGSK